MGRVLAITNQKGGVGKTTTCINLAAALKAKFRKIKVLVIDLDPQGNTTTCSGIDKHDLSFSMYHLLTNRCDTEALLFTNTIDEYDIFPANSDLTAAEIELLDFDDKEQILKQVLAGLLDHYDFILIDCPPALNMLTINALTAAHGIIIPIQCEYFALEGLSELKKTIEGIQQTINPNIVIEGLLRTMYDARTSLAYEVSEQLISAFGKLVYKTTIPRNVTLAEAPSHGQSVISYDIHSRGALAYLELASEVYKKSKAKFKAKNKR